MADIEHIRAVEATLFASETPLNTRDIHQYVGDQIDVVAALAALQEHYVGRGIELVKRGNRWHFQTAADLSYLLRRESDEVRKLSRAAIETLSIIAYHGPVSRAEIESIRGVQISKGMLDVLIQAEWVRSAGRREVVGRPLIYETTNEFLTHFGLSSHKDLPGIKDLKATGLLDPVDLVINDIFTEERYAENEVHNPHQSEDI